MHRATSRFWSCLGKLPKSIQKTARKNYELLKINPKHPLLHFKKVGGFWSARVGIHYRAIAVEDENDFIWVWVGTHEEYDHLIK
ncbi:MAG: hypothetical protein KAJ63_11365 [Methyloprofundus sp.]|nr:hypothetical protein [Methyloprofundus sp.]